MKKISLINTDLELSPMGMGCVNAGIKWDGEDAYRIFDSFLDMGGNVYDTARVYSDWIPSEIGRSAVNVYLVSGSVRAGNVITLYYSPRADIRI